MSTTARKRENKRRTKTIDEGSLKLGSEASAMKSPKVTRKSSLTKVNRCSLLIGGLPVLKAVLQ